ncbi:MAG: hypothetical protein IPM24_27600 [Bryobacterales bacterium]|nr:hypothetical protein [Bryobacterales bacterium]
MRRLIFLPWLAAFLHAQAIEPLPYVRTFADTLIEKGLDRHGSRHTALWAGVIDTQGFTVPRDGVPPPEGVRPNDRAVGGCNLYHDAVTLQFFPVLSAVTGDSRYRDAARGYVRDFLRVAQDPVTGFLAWGEHLYYDFFRDAPAEERRSHEMLEWTPPWGLLWDADPEATARAIAAIRYHYYGDDPALWFNRHASWGRAGFQAPRGQPWIKHTGLYSYSFLFLHSRSGEPLWRRWGLDTGALYWNYRLPATNLTMGCLGDPRPATKNASAGATLLAYWLLKAWRLAPEETLLRDRAVALLRAYDRHFYDVARDEYRTEVALDGTPLSENTVAPWHFAYGSASILPYGRVAAYFARTLESGEFTSIAKKVAAIARRTPLPERFSVEGIAFALNLSLDLYDLTAEDRYIEDARHYAGVAVKTFWVERDGRGLFVRQPGDRYYESKVGTGALAAGLLRLHLKQTPGSSDPGLYDWTF